MKKMRLLAVMAAAALPLLAREAAAEPRLALVIGQGAYPGGALPTTVNDAGLIGQTLQSAGFEVVQGRDLGGNDLRALVRDFLERAQDAGPEASLVVYIAGHAVQLEGENYLVPVDAKIAREGDVALEGLRISDLNRALASVASRVRIVMLDASREHAIPSAGQPVAKGLAVLDAPTGFIVAFSAAPGTVVADGPGPYGAYATALVEAMRQPGLRLEELFARVRLRVHESTQGRQIPWNTGSITARFAFFAPAPGAAPSPQVRVRRQILGASPEEAYGIAVEEDTIQSYQEFLRAFPHHPLARRVKVLLAARREALVWRRTVLRNTEDAYWTYLRRYPDGPHAGDCRRRLARLSAPLAPPASFVEVVYDDLPPPVPDVEIVEVRETFLTEWAALPPPPPAPVFLLPAPEPEVLEFVRLAPPPPPAPGILPVPIPMPLPRRAAAPRQFFAPVAPLTPQGPVRVPVADPASQGRAPPGVSPAAPDQGPSRPGQASVPGQPGLTAPIQPLPARAQAPAAGTAPPAPPAIPDASPAGRAADTGPAASRPAAAAPPPPTSAGSPRPGAVPGAPAAQRPGPSIGQGGAPAAPATARAIPPAAMPGPGAGPRGGRGPAAITPGESSGRGPGHVPVRAGLPQGPRAPIAARPGSPPGAGREFRPAPASGAPLPLPRGPAPRLDPSGAPRPVVRQAPPSTPPVEVMRPRPGPQGQPPGMTRAAPTAGVPAGGGVPAQVRPAGPAQTPQATRPQSPPQGPRAQPQGQRPPGQGGGKPGACVLPGGQPCPPR